MTDGELFQKFCDLTFFILTACCGEGVHVNKHDLVQFNMLGIIAQIFRNRVGDFIMSLKISRFMQGFVFFFLDLRQERENN